MNRLGRAGAATIVLVCCSLVAAVLGVAPRLRGGAGVGVTPAQAAPALAAGNRLSPWAPGWQDSGAVTYTRAEAVEIATRYDFIVTLATSLRLHVAAMKAANPDVQIHVYLQGTFAGTQWPEDWYLHDATGARIKESSGSSWLMDPRSAGWRDEVATRCRDRLVTTGYEGCFLDSLGAAPLVGNFVTAAPIDPLTGAVWTFPDWLTATSSLARHVTQQNVPAPISGNGLGRGDIWFDAERRTDGLARELTGGAMAELFLRTPSDPVDAWPDESTWRNDVDMLAAAAAMGIPVMTTTKVWSTPAPTAAEATAWYRLAAATFLLGSDGTARFAFSTERADGAYGTDYSQPFLDLGVPVGSYRHSDGAYQRDFAGGRVVVNPSTAPATVPLHTALRDEAGALVTTVVVAPRGAAFLRSDPSAPPVVSVRDVGVNEAGVALVVVTSSKPSGSVLGIDWTLASGTARMGTDFVAPGAGNGTGTLVIPAGATQASLAVGIVADALDEHSPETFSLTISPPAGVLAGQTVADVAIVDDDSPPALSVADRKHIEGSGATGLVVSLDRPSGRTVTASWRLVAGSAAAGVDYQDASGTLTIPEAATSVLVPIVVVDDDDDELAETVSVVLSSPDGATVADGTGRLTIVDADPTPTVTIGDGEVLEGTSGAAMGFTVRINAVQAAPVTVGWTTEPQSASPGTDYLPSQATVTIPAGSLSAQVSVGLVDDSADEGDETFTVRLTTVPAGVAIGDATARGRIVDNDNTPKLRVMDAEIGENGASIAFPVLVSPVASQPIGFSFETRGASAAAGVDFVTSTGNVTIPAGVERYVVSVPMLDDALDEANERLSLVVSAVTGGVLVTDAAAAGRIVDDENVVVSAPASLAIADAERFEGNSTGTMPMSVSISKRLTNDVMVDWVATAESATAGVDYTATTGTITIPAGTSTVGFAVPIVDDGLDEPTETFSVSIATTSQNVVVGDAVAAGRIVDDDRTPTLAVTGAEAAEASGRVAVRVRLDRVSVADVSFDVSTTSGSAVAGGDFVGSVRRVTIPAGSTIATVNITLVDDGLDEPTETFTVVISVPSGAVIADSSAFAVVLDDDPG